MKLTGSDKLRSLQQEARGRPLEEFEALSMEAPVPTAEEQVACRQLLRCLELRRKWKSGPGSLQDFVA